MNKISKDCYLELAVWLSHNYNGQGSRGYRLLSKLIDHYRIRWTSNFEHEAEQSEVYYYLASNYSKRI